MWPVPEGKGMRVQAREKWVRAKWRGVEKCSGGGVRGEEGKGEVEERTRDIADAEGGSHGGLKRGVGESKVGGVRVDMSMVSYDISGEYILGGALLIGLGFMRRGVVPFRAALP